jgi:hypothetical protein
MVIDGKDGVSDPCRQANLACFIQSLTIDFMVKNGYSVHIQHFQPSGKYLSLFPYSPAFEKGDQHAKGNRGRIFLGHRYS